MSLRAKIVLVLVVLCTTATLAIGVFGYRVTAHQLREQLDHSLESTAANLAGARARRIRGGLPAVRRDLLAESDMMFQVLDATGRPVHEMGTELPVDEVDRMVASASEPRQATRDVVIGRQNVRMLTVGGDRGNQRRGALQVARSLAETEQLLAQLRSRILVASAIVILSAAGLAWVIARQLTRRLVQLTAAAEQVSATRDLEVRVPVSGGDEAGRLGDAFNRMLTALARSKADQHRLVQDAGHELRTPLTSLRTNIYTLSRSDELSDDQQRTLMEDLRGETEELTRLIDEIVLLATDQHDVEPAEWVLLGALVDRVAERWSARSGRDLVVTVDDSIVMGRPMALERAVGNLIENTLKFAGDGAVEVSCTAGGVEVRDRGPGFSDDDLPLVFERFYRSQSSRSRPGSGLGLAIVADIVAEHGGTVSASNREGGGAVVGFTIPLGADRPNGTNDLPNPHRGRGRLEP